MNLAETAPTIFQGPFAIFQPIATIFEKPVAAASPSGQDKVFEASASFDPAFTNATTADRCGDSGITASQALSSSAAVGLGLMHPSIRPAYGALAANMHRPTSVAALLFLFRIAAALTHCRAIATRPFLVSFEESGATTLEWLFPHARLLFAFESDGSATYSLYGKDRDAGFGEITAGLAIEQLLSSTCRR